MYPKSALALLLLTFCALVATSSPARSQAPVDKAGLAWTLPWDADWVTAVSFIGPNRLAAGNNLGDILVWDLPDKTGGPAPKPSRHLMGHTNVINRLISTPDNRWLISASNDHAVCYWDMQAEPTAKGKVVLNARAIRDAESKKKKAPPANDCDALLQKATQTLTGHKDWVLGLSLTRDGTTLVTGDDKGEIIVWDRASGKEKKRWKLNGWAFAVAISPEGKSLLVSERKPLVFDSGRMSAVKLWDPQSGDMKADLSKDIKEIIGVAAFSPDGKWLAIGRAGEAEGKVMLLDPTSGKKLKDLTPIHYSGVTDLVFHPDGKHLLSSGRDTHVKIWKLEDGKLVKELGQPRGGQFKDWFHAVAVSPDGRWIAAADMAGQVQVWSARVD